MASPDVGDQGREANQQISFRFCTECSNLLFPREDKTTNRLLFACRTCSFTQEAPSACVMRHEIASTTGDTAGVTQEVGQDPTLPRVTTSTRCKTCNDDQAVFFQSQQRTADTGMKLYYVCCGCGNVWQ